MKVLVGVDGSSNSFAAVEFVGRLLAAQRDELVLLFATPAMSFDDERLDPAIESAGAGRQEPGGQRTAGQAIARAGHAARSRARSR